MGRLRHGLRRLHPFGIEFNDKWGEVVRAVLLRVIAALAIGLLTGACALAPETIEVAAKPANSTSQEGAGASVELRVVDGRSSYRDRVGTKKNGYGVELARIKSSRSPLDVVRDSVQQELQGKGFIVGSRGVVVTIELLSFYSDFKPAFIIPTAESVADVSFSLQVGPPGGPSTYAHIYRGSGSSTDAFVMTPGSARVALDQALGAAMVQVSDDSGLRAALVSAQGSVPARPTAPTPNPVAKTAPSPTGTATPVAPDATPPPPIDFGQGLSRSRL
jgi:uncharacterized lipoprotein YajG